MTPAPKITGSLCVAGFRNQHPVASSRSAAAYSMASLYIRQVINVIPAFFGNDGNTVQTLARHDHRVAGIEPHGLIRANNQIERAGFDGVEFVSVEHLRNQRLTAIFNVSRLGQRLFKRLLLETFYGV